MMIRINLLPVRQEKKRELGRQFLVLTAGVLIVAVAGNWVWYSNRDGERARRDAQAQDTQRRISELEKVIGEVNNINKRKKEVSDKLAVLDKLRRQRAGPVRMLDALASSIPKKVWISAFVEQNGGVRMSGQGESYDDVSEFSKALQHVVWTPKGMGRVVDQKRDATTARVQLFNEEQATEDFPLTEIAYFFTNVDLKNTAADSTVNKQGQRFVSFEMVMAANYAL